MTRLGLLLLLSIAAAFPLTARQAAPTFEVASIKPSQSTEQVAFIHQDTGGRFRAENITVFGLIQQAYNLFDFQISGAPGWLNRDRFDVDAIAPSTALRQGGLLQRLLEERFSLRVRREKREDDIYALVVARSDGRLGPGLRPFPGNCTPAPGGSSPCTMRNGPNFTDAIGMPLSFIVGQAAGNVNRIVIDKTGLTGRFEFSYKWTSDPSATDGVSFITALEEQLGLKLERTRGLIEVLVIDSVERPTPN
jgi:uncharacterized protein (TIGR03435 family)